MKKKLLIGGFALLALVLVGGGVFWLNHAGYIHLFKSHNSSDAAHSEEMTAIDVKPDLRKLFEYQDKVAKGDSEALAAQEETIETLSGSFQKLKPADWREPTNVNAMMAYVLSGGGTEAVERFLESETATEQQKALATGILSFALGRPKTALKQVGEIDPRTIDQPIVGAMSLALAAMHTTEDKSRSVALYDEARLHAPGTAVEEAALRRQFPLLLASSTPDRATMLLARYVRVFGKSLYAPTFFQASAAAIANLDEAKAVAMTSALSETLSDESDDKKIGLFLGIAQSAVMSGHVKLAKSAADVAIGLRTISEPDKNKAKFYRALAVAPTEAAGSALGELESLNAADLDPADAAIKSAAAMVARSIVNASNGNVGAAQIQTPTQGDAQPGQPRSGADGGVGAIVNRADIAVKAADKILTTEAP